MISLKTFFTLCGRTYSQWQSNKAPVYGAALAYYAVFSLAPIVVLILSISGLLLGKDAAQSEMMKQLSGLIGHEATSAISAIIASAGRTSSAELASVGGLITLLIGATGVFCQLQDAMNAVWQVRRAGGSAVLWIIIERWVSLVMVLGIGFLLLLSLFISALLAAFSTYLSGLKFFSAMILHGVHLLISVGLTMLLFAAIFKFLPSVRVPWRCVWGGAFLTAILFSLGKSLIGIYIGQSAIASSYGAAASIPIVLIWTYYSSQILLFGAQFTQVYATWKKLLPQPKDGYTIEKRPSP